MDNREELTSTKYLPLPVVITVNGSKPFNTCKKLVNVKYSLQESRVFIELNLSPLNYYFFIDNIY